jgi:hypothetical protein
MKLSAQQLQLLQLMGDGNDLKGAAAGLRLDYQRSKNLMGYARALLQLTSTYQLLAHALRQEWID